MDKSPYSSPARTHYLNLIEKRRAYQAEMYQRFALSIPPSVTVQSAGTYTFKM